MLKTIRSDVQAVLDRDPAARNALEVVLLYPGLHALWLYRVAHVLWRNGLFFAGRLISQFARWLTGIEIHPGAQIGPGFFVDHGMATVIGETAEIGAYVTLYHNVTLGGVSLEKVKRHPTLEDHVVVGAGAQILGPIVIGEHSRIGSNSVVVKDVPPHSVVVGVPGRIIVSNGKRLPEPAAAGGEDLHHNQLPDPTVEMIRHLTARVVSLEASLSRMNVNEYSTEAADAWVDVGGSHI
ncbi:MAG TPA: serine O-acetyltransferase EpsC [Anaerolineae bacterium]